MLSAQQIKDFALTVGFSHCGIARARRLNSVKQLFEAALAQGYHADMHFLERDVEKRFDPSLLLPGCQSVVVVTYNYCIEENPAADKYRAARYTWIEDYHNVVKTLLDRVVEQIQKLEPCQCRVTVDSSCISEKNWAVEAGVGIYGKNGLIHNEDGSFFVLGTILIDKAVDFYDFVRNSDCGTCRSCIENCPAHALDTPYKVDASKCFSYHTIENKNPDNEILAKAPFVFGCDICQEVCPKNKKNIPNSLNKSKSSVFLRLQNEGYENLTREEFKTCFGGTAIARRKYERFYRAIQAKK